MAEAGPVLIMAGGTGGHVFPGLAVAAALQRRGVGVCWLGSPSGLEAKLVPAAGIPLEAVHVAGLRGKGLARKLSAPLMLLRAAWEALRILRRIRPRAVLGMGGFVSGPGAVVAWLLRIPLVVHEQNSVAGYTNRQLARIARRVLQAFPGSFPDGPRVMTVGNPVRAAIAALPAPAQRLKGRSGPLRLLVFGGSQGARALNTTVPRAVASLPAGTSVEVWHQAGGRMLEEARASYREAGVSARLEAFIDDMAAAYEWADLVICRSGALSVSELAAAGVGAILVPYPHAVDDHQTANAAFLERAGAARIVQERDMDAAGLSSMLAGLAADRPKLLTMAEAARSRAIVDADERVSRTLLREAGGASQED